MMTARSLSAQRIQRSTVTKRTYIRTQAFDTLSKVLAGKAPQNRVRRIPNARATSFFGLEHACHSFLSLLHKTLNVSLKIPFIERSPAHEADKRFRRRYTGTLRKLINCRRMWNKTRAQLLLCTRSNQIIASGIRRRSRRRQRRKCLRSRT